MSDLVKREGFKEAMVAQAVGAGRTTSVPTLIRRSKQLGQPGAQVLGAQRRVVLVNFQGYP